VELAKDHKDPCQACICNGECEDLQNLKVVSYILSLPKRYEGTRS
jgi:hypothetical protein